ncbi:hypothetical protein [Rubrivivax rivuli]|uniref:Uncharacterized protein n=1 Tax=Rubrivivax rivuli TaxID=1862385 RepID=A0A437RKH1_9BURK|nr:hypothetical protein [Rubrivivax rivuli]RVU47162.1 hypothetical protein EOE66_05215 [Rubrivivax rivuli]
MILKHEERVREIKFVRLECRHIQAALAARQLNQPGSAELAAALREIVHRDCLTWRQIHTPREHVVLFAQRLAGVAGAYQGLVFSSPEVLHQELRVYWKQALESGWRTPIERFPSIQDVTAAVGHLLCGSRNAPSQLI